MSNGDFPELRVPVDWAEGMKRPIVLFDPIVVTEACDIRWAPMPGLNMMVKEVIFSADETEFKSLGPGKNSSYVVRGKHQTKGKLWKYTIRVEKDGREYVLDPEACNEKDF